MQLKQILLLFFLILLLSQCNSKINYVLGAYYSVMDEKLGNAKVKVLAETLDAAIGMYLENGKLPCRKAGEIDNRGSSFYLALYWSEALSEQNKDKEMN